MSEFSDVDRSAGSSLLVSYLHVTDSGLGAMKSYMAVAARLAVGEGVVVDIGSGVGHDVERLRGLGLTAIGLDVSEIMVTEARARLGAAALLLRGDAAALPLTDASVDGCRAERVLQHVEEPEAVVAETARVLRPGGFLAAFEPDYSTFRVATDDPAAAAFPASLMRVRHPTVGGELVAMFERHGFRIEDVVTEASRGYRLDGLPVDSAAVIARAIRDGRVDAAIGARWLAEQRARTEAGTFEARWDKILVIARRRDRQR